MSLLNLPAIERELLKRELESDYLKFVQYAFLRQNDKAFDTNSHHEDIAHFLEDIVCGNKKNGIINIAPRYSKTCMSVVYFVAWSYAKNINCNFMHLSYSNSLVQENSSDIRDIIRSDWYQELWPRVIKKDADAKNKWKIEGGGTFFAAPTGGQVTGMGAGSPDDTDNVLAYDWLSSYSSFLDVCTFNSDHTDVFSGAILIDDPIKPEDAYSKVMRDKTNRRLSSTIMSRRNSPTKTPIIITMQRVHDEDMSGFCISGKAGEDFDHLCLPALKEDGTALWPKKHTVEQLRAMEKTNNYSFTGQYQQRPIVLGGNIIKPSEFNRYSVLPMLKKRFITADTALKDGDHNDYTCFQCWGIGYDNMLYLIDLLRVKIQSKDLKQRFSDFWNKNNQLTNVKQYGYLSCAYIEDKASGTQLVQEIQMLHQIPVVALQRNRSKLERVMDILLPRMLYVSVPFDAPWVSDFYTECEGFSADMSHKHDDQIDPLVDAVEIGGNEILLDSGDVLGDNLRRKIMAKSTVGGRRRGRR